ncbi:hypothetical protein ACIREM_16745 [Streptomyces shenzhenensis]|uniref:hypothetical protein n=1 Tax=Streptomyces shenzhenensis TaxID=943815 RepID=UPI003828DDD6
MPCADKNTIRARRHPVDVRIAIVCTPAGSSWLNWIEARGGMVRRYIIWRSQNAAGKRLTVLVRRANAV